MPPVATMRNRRWLMAVTLVAGLGPGMAAIAHAQQQDRDGTKAALEGVEQNIARKKSESEKLSRQAEQLKGEVMNLNVLLVGAAKKVQEQEQKIFELESELKLLARNAGEKEKRLRQRAEQFSGVVMALARMSRMPTEALVVQPVGPEEMVRSAIALRAAVPQLEGRARVLRDELEGLKQARGLVEAKKASINSAAEGLRAERDSLEKLVNRKTAMRAEAISRGRAASSEMLRLSKKASTLRELMEKIEKSREEVYNSRPAPGRGAPPSEPRQQMHAAPGLDAGGAGGESGLVAGSIARARGQLPFPAVGKLVGLYGQDLGSGLVRKGISIETRAHAQVVSPFDGKVVFSGPFRGYGQLLIIDHGEGYHSLLAGLGDIDTQLGSVVLAGEPVARMGPEDQAQPGSPVLYVEFRRNNEPINPLPWLANTKGKTQG